MFFRSLSNLKNNIAALLKLYDKAYGFELVVLFGSGVRGQGKGHDLDIGFLTRERMHQWHLESFILDLMRLTGSEKIDTVDLFVSDNKPTLIQMEAYATGSLLYERQNGLFDKNKTEMIAAMNRVGITNIAEAVIADKLNKLSEEISLLNFLYNYNDQYVEYPGRPDSSQRDVMSELVWLAVSKKVDEVVASAMKLNAYYLNRIADQSVDNPLTGFLSLTELGLPKECSEAIARTGIFRSVQNIGYKYGSAWSVKEIIQAIFTHYPRYIEFIYDRIGQSAEAQSSYRRLKYHLDLAPRNATEEAIMRDDAWFAGADWGMPRRGHPEGKVAYHIRDVLYNIDHLSQTVSLKEIKKLRFIALVHDTFKHRVDMNAPRAGDNDHAVMARKFAEQYTDGQAILDIIENHDEAYLAWQEGTKSGNWDVAGERLRQLMDRLGEQARLYYLFFTCDNETGDKKQDCLRWFEDETGL